MGKWLWTALLLIVLAIGLYYWLDKKDAVVTKDTITAKKDRLQSMEDVWQQFSQNKQIERIELRSTYDYRIPILLDLSQKKGMINISNLPTPDNNDQYHLWSENEDGSYRNIRILSPLQPIVPFDIGTAQRYFITKQIAGDVSLPNMKELVAF